ncbi:MAG: hypothetical protein ACOCZ5_00585 [bacterium]
MEEYRKNEYRKEVLDKLNELWSKFPQWRLSQLIVNAINIEHDIYYSDMTDLEHDIFLIEDNELIKKIEELSDAVLTS